MDVREKLVELIIDAKRTDPETGSFTEYLADHLIANGVTVQEWISVKDRLPRCGDRVIVTDGVFVCEAFLSISGKWVRNGIGWIESEITHWMPMPNPPKGE